ncbi:UNVERIFIED_CONTAM: hypothetical protein Sradi_5386400 [Sesamum radiatum]|uniref:Uncharacterized protein n=1 Tax=Sesamum radiatum TaxID=300843 RepID=A0AAW2LRY3_SESRA
MASLVLLLSEILRLETIDNLISTPPPSSSATAPRLPPPRQRKVYRIAAETLAKINSKKICLGSAST